VRCATQASNPGRDFVFALRADQSSPAFPRARRKGLDRGGVRTSVACRWLVACR
jgi:hypothetical protein